MIPNICNSALPYLALLEWRLASPTVLSLCVAGAFGMHAVWGALDSSGRALIANQLYRKLLEGLDEKVDLFKPLVDTEMLFRAAVIAWVVATAFTISSLAVVPMDLDFMNSNPRPTFHAIFHLGAIAIATGLSTRAWLRRMALDRQIHRVLNKADQYDRMQRSAA